MMMRRLVLLHQTARWLSSARRSVHDGKRIVVVGGTHGNEYTGVWLVKELLATESLGVEPFLANGHAIAINRRFADEDLNRCFSREKLSSAAARGTAEALRSLEIDAALGPKGSADAADLVVDLHTTTAAMGTTLIVDAWCPFALRCAAFVQRRLSTPEAPVRIMFNDIRDQELSPYLASVGKTSLQIEVGPTAQGLVRADVVAATRDALRAVVDFAHHGAQHDADLPETVTAFSTAGSHMKLAWPVDDDGFPTAMVHEALQDRDWLPLATGDPLWRDRAGLAIPYDGALGSPVFPIFINEAGYYYASSGRGIGVAKEISLRVPDAGAASIPRDDAEL